MRFISAVLIVSFVSFASAGLKESLMDVMEKYQKVQVAVPPSLNAKGIIENIRNVINNRQVTIRFPFLSSFTLRARRNQTRTASTTPSYEQIGVTSTTTTTTTTGSPISTAPTKAGGQHSDWCGGSILMDLSSGREVTYKSTQFPAGRSTPYACLWEVKVSKNCRYGRVTMRVDGRSRLSDDKRCSKGYYRVTPFMKEAKICGRIGTVPPFQWYVDDQQQQDVTIIMKNIGLDDGDTEGISFTLSGECLSQSYPAKHDAAIENVDLNSRWMQRLLIDSQPGGKRSEIVIHTASMSFMPSSKLVAKASEKISQEGILADNTTAVASTTTTKTPVMTTKPTKLVFYSPLYLIFRRLKLI